MNGLLLCQAACPVSSLLGQHKTWWHKQSQRKGENEGEREGDIWKTNICQVWAEEWHIGCSVSLWGDHTFVWAPHNQNQSVGCQQKKSKLKHKHKENGHCLANVNFIASTKTLLCSKQVSTLESWRLSQHVNAPHHNITCELHDHRAPCSKRFYTRGSKRAYTDVNETANEEEQIHCTVFMC